MIKEFNGKEGTVSNRKFIIVVSEYNREITDKLRQGALKTLADNQVAEQNISVVWVPGAWELSLAAQHVLKFQNPDAVICLGCVIRGETTHDQHINTTVSQSLGRLGLEYGVPIGFGLLTCNTWDQAVQRSGGNVGNKGVETAEAVLAMLRLFHSMA